MSLKSLSIHNFQSHKNTEIELSPLVTAIIGLNNHGKSAVLRAFQKVIRNEPAGTTFVSDGTNQCELTLVTGTGKVCRSVKNNLSADANKYTINDEDEFVKFDTDIPVEVLPLLDTSPIQQFGDIEVDFNFQSQLDQLFLVQGDGLASKRGKILGSVTGVDVVNRAIQLCASEMKSLKGAEGRNEQQIVEINNKLDAYVHVDDVGVAVRALCVNGAWCEEVADKIAVYKNLLSSLENLVEKASKATSIVEAIDLEDVENTIEEVKALQKRITVCKSLLLLQERIQKAQQILSIPVPKDTTYIQKLISKIKVAKSLDAIIQQQTAAKAILAQTKDLIQIEKTQEKVRQIQNTLQTYSSLYSTLQSLQIKLSINLVDLL